MKSNQEFLESVAAIARERNVFASIEVRDDALRCRARDVEEEAWYVVEPKEGGWTVSLVTSDRWLSESIETDLMHFGDPLEELIEEELVELGSDFKVEAPKHFRNDDRQYVFVNRVSVTGRSIPEDAAVVANWLLAYEAAFRNLGDMSGAEKE
ncbi:MAG: hypothetical protein K8R92_10970 [Planctomycetes bacterium]|nr:hypothetical protein [Planctomycetota bacterium]